MKKLGFGLMRLPQIGEGASAQIDFETVCAMVDRFLEQGFTYFDTAYMYMEYQSEDILRRAVVERHPRESFTVADIQYIGYHLYYTANPEADEINQQATFSVENGALTYLNEGIVEELGFLISDKDADQYYMG